MKVKIETGRMHQIRIHLADAGYPVLGDITYGKPVINRILYKSLGINRQLLHCWKYSFYDYLSSQQRTFEAPMPNDFEKVIENR